MARFTREHRSSHNLIKTILPAAIFVAVMVLFIAGVFSMRSQTAGRQKENLINALNRDIVYCYATEGYYPESLQYMKDHYGLTYDESRFYVDYRILAANIYPDVTIIEIEEQEEP